MVNHEKIRNKLKTIQISLEKLHQLKAKSEDVFISDFTNTDAARHNLQIAIQAMLDISSHIISRLRFEFPKSNVDAFSILSEHSIVSKDKLVEYQEMARFRNRLVHMYDDVDNRVIYEVLQKHLGDYESFIKDIVQYLETKRNVDK